jgi:hypothetical protein
LQLFDLICKIYLFYGEHITVLILKVGILQVLIYCFKNIFELIEICVLLQHENNNNTKLYTATDLSERIAMY